MAMIKLPPTPLASMLVSTVSIYVAQRLGKCLEVRRDDRGFLEVSMDVDQRSMVKELVSTLRSPEFKPREVGRLPFIPGGSSGTDGNTISSIFSSVGLARPSLSASNKLKLYDRFVSILDTKKDLLAKSLSNLEVSTRGGVLSIELGGREVPVPVAVKSEAFYEIGRFGGLSDRKKGRPSVGRIDYRASIPMASLLYALLLSLQTGYEGGVNAFMFTGVQLELGRMESVAVDFLAKSISKIIKEVSKVGLGVWSQDYEGLRIATLTSMMSQYLKCKAMLPSNVVLTHVIMSMTGRRFLPLATISLPIAEAETFSRVAKSFVKELGIDELYLPKILNLLKLATVSCLRMLSRTTASSIRELWQGLKMLTYSFLEGSKWGVLDMLYKTLRLLSDVNTGLRTELVGGIIKASEELSIELEDIVIEGDPNVDKARSVWRSLRKLVNLITS